jgi:ceramide glucosyltransferase
VLGATLQAFPLLAALDHSGMVGKLVAVDRKTLDEIGSFDALVGSLGEDVELASRLRARGASIVVAGVARSRPRGVDLRRALERFVRWLLVVRAQRPWLLVTYPLFFFPAIPCALLALASGGVAGRISASLFLLARVSVASSAIPRVLRETSALEAVLEGLAGDAMLAVAFARVLASPRVRWAGAALRVTAGRIEPEEP